MYKYLKKVRSKGFKGILFSINNRVKKEIIIYREKKIYKKSSFRNIEKIDLNIQFNWYDFIKNTKKYLYDQNLGLPKFINSMQQRIENDEVYFNSCLNAANKLVNNTFYIYGKHNHFTNDPLWNLDIDGSGFWGRKYWRRFKFPDQSGKRGDYRFIWELNRHQHLYILGLVFHKTKNSKYAETIIKTMLSWISQNPPFNTINWASAMELSIRLVSWANALMLISEYTSLTDNEIEKIVKSMLQQLLFLEEHLSVNIVQGKGEYVKLRNNHTIVELCGVIYVCSMLSWIPSFRKAANIEKWQKDLCAEMKSQFYADGIHVEQSTSYMRFTLEAIILCALSIADNDCSQEIHNAVEKSVKTLRAFVYHDNTFILIGDEDNGHFITTRWDPRPDDLRDVEFLYSVLTDHLLNKGMIPSRYEIPKNYGNSISSFFCFSDSGHWVKHFTYEGKHVTIYFRAGPMSFPHIPNYAPHVHSDLLSFMLFVDNKCLFTDSGTYSYHYLAERNSLRLSHSHNTIKFSTQEQMRVIGPFNVVDFADSKIIKADSINVIGEMKYSKDKSKTQIMREITIDDKIGHIYFRDVIKSNKKGKIRWYLNFHPEIELLSNNSISLPSKKWLVEINNLPNMKWTEGEYSAEYGSITECKKIIGEVESYGSGKEKVVEWNIALQRASISKSE